MHVRFEGTAAVEAWYCIYDLWSGEIGESFQGLVRNSRVGPAERKPSEIRMPLRRLVAGRKRPAEFVIDHIKAPIHSKIVPGSEV